MHSEPPVQLSLGISLQDEATFNNFYFAGDNDTAVLALQQVSQGNGELNTVIWGQVGSGLSHLLQSCCHQAFRLGLTVQYLPLRELSVYAPEQVCDGLESCQLVCLDDVDCIAGDEHWEVAVFHLYNRLRERGHSLLMACHGSPASLGVRLADLQSRIMGSVVFQIHPLSDEGKTTALSLRARNRGMDMAEDVARYILARVPRDTAALFTLLNTLDDASLQHQRKLTIPFVKSVLNL